MERDDLQRNFEGYLNTPLLWQDAKVYNLQQCDLTKWTHHKFTLKSTGKLRLGKLVERFVCHQLSDHDSYTILAENVQIQDGKKTIGELDALLLMKNEPIHLEIVYKFYLYEPDEGNDELSHWIGPNRKDSLIQKLYKLKQKQLPLLYHPQTLVLLDNLSLDRTKIKQQVLFKAQLFLPLDYPKIVCSNLNPDCIKGFYITKNELHRFETAKFYIPEKINWLMEVDRDVNWLNYEAFTSEVTEWLDKKLAPLCWLRMNGVLRKFFVVWW